jgi:MFS family permease
MVDHLTSQYSSGETQPAPAVAIASVIASMAVVAIGNGLMFAYIPVRLAVSGFAPTWAGSILTGFSVGGIAGCFFTGWLVQRVGHARAYMVCSGLIVLSNCGIGAGIHPGSWIGARALYGFATSGLFIIAQSWLNDVIGNAIRGRVMTFFYIFYVLGIGCGYYLLGVLDIDGPSIPLIGIAFTAISMLPIGLTRLAQPPPPIAASLNLAKAWRISPVGLAGMLTVGGLTTISGFAPIHLAAKGYSQQDIATTMSLMPLGTIILQMPFGWISDRVDRRYVLVATSTLAFAGALLAIGIDGSPLVWVIPAYMIWDGASGSIYALSSAHASDRAGKDDLVTLSSALLFAWSASGFIVLGAVTLLTAFYGTNAYMFVCGAIAASYSVFTLWRIGRTRSVPTDVTGSFFPMTAQAPLPADLVSDADPGSGKEAETPAPENR